jgi:two-component system, NarL family, sensor histidine kinase DesK
MSVSGRIRLLPSNKDVGWTPYAWLIFLSAFFVQPLVGHSSVGWWLAYFGGALVFLMTYFRAHWVGGRQLIAMAFVQLALGVGFSAVNTGAYIFFTYSASTISRLERTRIAIASIIMITGLGLLVAFAVKAPLYFWIGHGVFTPLIGMVNLHFSQVSRSNATLRAAHEEIEHLAAVAERERIARDLHDILGHTLSLIILKAELASKLADRDPARAATEIRDVEQVSRAALSEVRHAIRGYRPTLAEELGRARTLLDTARITATVDTAIDSAELHTRDGVEETMALALREAVTNVVRHSGATRVDIRARRENGSAMLEITDDGRGTAGAEGAGLRGMRARVESVDGQLTFASQGGTSVRVSIPLSSS